MALYQTVYFMSLVGGFAGLIAWAISALLSGVLSGQTHEWLSDFVASAVLGALIGGLTIAFGDKWSGTRIQPRWVLSGSLIGLLAGAVAGLAQIPIKTNLGPSFPTGARVIAWVLAGSCIGIGLGLRWVSVNPLRVVHAFLGGLIGGALGGMIFAGLGSEIPDVSQALGFVFVGVGICFGVALAPVLLRNGILQFVSSGDARAQYKFGRKQKQWELQDGDSYVVGRGAQDVAKTAYRPAVQVFIPDATLAPRHAIVYARGGKFHIARHPETAGEPGVARYVVQVRGRTVTKSQELRHMDDILIGRTALRFEALKREG